MLQKPHFRITLIYIVISSLWIFFSDKFLLITFKSADFITRVQTYKGILFVLFTGCIIFFLIRSSYNTLKEKNEKIQLLANSKDFFLKNISHELKTPLNGIILINELLKDNNNINKNKLILELEHCSSELNELISNIIEVSERQSNKIDVQESKIDLASFAWSIGILYYLSAQKKGVDLGIYIDPELPSSVVCDKKRLKRIIGNLLENAVKFTSEGYILFEVINSSNNGTVLFKITDTGSGFKSEAASEIFNSFFSKTYTSNKLVKGLGTGLIIAKQNSYILNGNIWFESSVNKGSIFYFEISFKDALYPDSFNTENYYTSQKIIVISEYQANNIILKKELEYYGCDISFKSFSFNINDISGTAYTFIVDSDAPSSVISSIKEFLTKDSYSKIIFIHNYFKKSNDLNSIVLPFKTVDIVNTIFNKKKLKKINVLIADDNDLNRELLSSIIEKEVDEVFSAKNGSQAFEIWTQYKPDIVFLDINLPDSLGYEISKKIRSAEKDNRCIIIAISAYKIDESKLRENGFDFFIEKPFKFEEIYTLILQMVKIKSEIKIFA